MLAGHQPACCRLRHVLSSFVPDNVKEGYITTDAHLFMAGIHQAPGLLHLRLEGGDGALVLLAEAQGCLHLCRIGHNLVVQFLDLFGKPLFIVCMSQDRQFSKNTSMQTDFSAGVQGAAEIAHLCIGVETRRSMGCCWEGGVGQRAWCNAECMPSRRIQGVQTVGCRAHAA